MVTYREAAERLWGAAGRYAHDVFDLHNSAYFDDSLPSVPIVIGFLAYGQCLGSIRGGIGLPRITLAAGYFAKSLTKVDDTLLHEMVHVALLLRGEDARHSALPWCFEITRISKLLGVDVTAQPIPAQRTPNPAREHGPKVATPLVARRADPGWLSQRQIAQWPRGSVRSPEHYAADRRTVFFDT